MDWLCLLGVLAAVVSPSGAAANRELSRASVQIVNYADSPVHATAVALPRDHVYRATGLASGQPLHAVDDQGRRIPLLPGVRDGEGILQAYLSLKPAQRIDLSFRAAAEWSTNPATAEFDLRSGRGVIGNGLVRLDYGNGKWRLCFDGPLADSIAPMDQRELIRNCTIDLWLDSRNRGRLLDYKPEDLRKLGLIHTSEARLVDGEARVHPDGSVSLKLVHRFGGFASEVTWTQTYTLQPALPQVIMDIDFTVAGDATVWLAYVNQGSGLDARYGSLLEAKPLFKFVDPAVSDALIAGGASSPVIRVSWRGERCWLGLAGASGAGLGVSTLEETRELDRGSTVWNVGYTDFRATLLENERKHFPFDISRERPFRNGLTLLASSGGIDMWRQTRALFRSAARKERLELMHAYAVFVDGVPVQPGYVRDRMPGRLALVATADGEGLQAAVRTDLEDRKIVTLEAKASAGGGPLVMRARPLAGGEPVELLRVPGSGQHAFDLGDRLPADLRRLAPNGGVVLELAPAVGLAAFALEQAPPAAPRLVAPRDRQSVTDLAVFYRWKRVGEAIDYELQWSSEPDFAKPQSRTIRMETPLAFYMPTEAELPAPGTWHWRVRVKDGGRPGEWSEVRSMVVNNDHAKRPLQYVIDPRTPLFTIEGCRIKRDDVGRFLELMPQQLRRYSAYILTPYEDGGLAAVEKRVEFFAPLAGSGMRFFTRAMHPGPMAEVFESLSEVEALFRDNPNAMGICTGEAMSALYRDVPHTRYTQRLIRLCAKYGKLFYIADGTYPQDDKWVAMYSQVGDFLAEHRGYVAFAQKNNILHRQMLSQSATLGLYLSGFSVAHGAWEDGGWYWQQVGFRELGNLQGQRGGDVRAMPRIFWALNFVMGISRGTTIFSLEGQTGTAPTQTSMRPVDKPLAANPSAYWTRDGELLPTFSQFIEPLLKAIVERDLIPSKRDLLDQTRIAVFSDGVTMREDQDPYYRQYHSLFAGTYGFKPMGIHPGELYEFFPNTGRYHYIPFLPQGKVDLGHGIEVLPLSGLMDPSGVRETFNSRYPQWYEGNALVGLIGDTLTVLNANENLDERQSYRLPLKDRGIFRGISGSIEVHSYLVGKFGRGNKSLWMQVNSEYADRRMELVLACEREPEVKVQPVAALVGKDWNGGALTLHLSHAYGAVELELR
jgi:hypothetical protein